MEVRLGMGIRFRHSNFRKVRRTRVPVGFIILMIPDLGVSVRHDLKDAADGWVEILLS